MLSERCLRTIGATFALASLAIAPQARAQAGVKVGVLSLWWY
jgi:hypothetical protein